MNDPLGSRLANLKQDLNKQRRRRRKEGEGEDNDKKAPRHIIIKVLNLREKEVRQWNDIFNVLKEKYYQLTVLYPVKISFFVFVFFVVVPWLGIEPRPWQ